MQLFEMQGLLAGKCLPGDMLVGESLAKYLLRHINQRDELARQVSALQTSQDNIINGLGIKGDGPYSKLVIEYVLGLVAENAYLLPKAASELSNAWVLHKYLIGIQAAIMHLESGRVSAAQEWLNGTISGPGFEFPDDLDVGDDIDAWANHQMRDSISHPRALEIIKAEAANIRSGGKA